MKNNFKQDRKSDTSNQQHSSNESPAPKKSRTMGLLGEYFNISAWANWSGIKSSIQYLQDLIKRLFVLQPYERGNKTAQFTKVMSDLALTEDELNNRARGLLRLSYLMLVITLLFLAYTVYLGFHGSLKAILIAAMETIVAGTLAFRYHFWHFQIQQRQLGCSVKQWTQSFFRGGQS